MVSQQSACPTNEDPSLGPQPLCKKQDLMASSRKIETGGCMELTGQSTSEFHV